MEVYMGAFEKEFNDACITEKSDVNVKDENTVAYKVYDSCRRQESLTVRELGAAMNYCSGEIVTPPAGATSVFMEGLKISKIRVVNKEPCSFRDGFWDINIEYAFSYKLNFRESRECDICSVDAYSTFNSNVTLFGSTGNGLVISTDLPTYGVESVTFDDVPFTWTEAKVVGLDAQLHHSQAVHCTIGLFSIMKLIRIVHLNVQATSFNIPEVCEDIADINPCEYFAALDFPVDVFAPPQRNEF